MVDVKIKQPRVAIVTPVGTAAYAYHHAPDTKGQFADGKYKGQLVMAGNTDMSKLETTVRAFAAAVFPDDDLSDLRLPWKAYDGEKEEFQGKIILKASTKHKPTVCDTKRQLLSKSVEARSGDDCRYAASLYAYKKMEKIRDGKKIVDVVMIGVSLQLNTVQLVKKNAGGGASVDAFDDIEGFDLSEVEDFAGDDVPFAGGSTRDDNGGDF
jgi:hypothetical protein